MLSKPACGDVAIPADHILIEPIGNRLEDLELNALADARLVDWQVVLKVGLDEL